MSGSPDAPPASAGTGRDEDRGGTWVLRYWRGLYPLGVSFWIVFILGTIVVQTVAPYNKYVLETLVYDPRVIFADVLCVSVAITAIAVVQWVGVWRSAARARRRAAGRGAAWAILAQIFVVFSIANAVRVTTKTVVPTLGEFYTMAFRDDPSVPAFALRATRDGTQLLVFGGFKFGLTDRFLALSATLPRLRTVHLASIGGRLGEARHLFTAIQARALDTYVSDICYSACTAAFVAGKKRWMLPTAKLGFHEESFRGVAVADDGDGVGESALFSRAGIAPYFITKVQETSPKDLWTPTVQDLLDAHVVTDIADGGQFAASSLGMNPSREAIGTMLTTALPVVLTLAAVHPDRYDAIVEATRAAYLAGDSEIALGRLVGTRIDRDFADMLPKADDASLVAYATLLDDEYTAMAAIGSSRCYDFLHGRLAHDTLAAELGPAIASREAALKAQVLGGTAAAPVVPATEVEAIRTRYARALAKAAPAEDVATIGTPTNDPKRQARICRALIAIYRVAASLPPREAGIVLRAMVAGR